MTPPTKYLDVGIYRLPEAARLAGVSPDRIRRWLKGYRSTLRKKTYAALWTPQFPEAGSKYITLGFLDLIEAKVVNAFLDQGVSWPMIHTVRQKAAELFPGVSHPFCTKGFVTDGHSIFAEVHRETGEQSLIEIAADQHVFAEVTRPFSTELEFEEGAGLKRWWPMGKDRHIIIDPRKNFGQPTVFPEGIPTRVLVQSVAANGSVEAVSQWYEISPPTVQEALDYEQSLAS